MRWFNDLPIGARLTIGFALMVVLGVTLGVVSYTGMTNMKTESETTKAVSLPAIENLAMIDTRLRDVKAHERALLLDVDANERKDQVAKTASNWQDIESAIAKLGKLDLPESDRAVLETMKPQVAAFKADDDRFLKLIVAHYAAPGDTALRQQAYAFHFGDETKSYDAVHEAVVKLTDQVYGDAQAAVDATYAAENRALLQLSITLAVSLALAIVTAAAISRGVTGQLSAVIAGLKLGAGQVSVASDQIAQASQQMAEGSSEQASSLEETSSSLEEMASMTRQNAENARQASLMAAEMRSSAEKGLLAMQDMSGAIGKVKESADSTAKIVKTIDDIAFQTNLLALNAAVEAARAGEAGKGFAVVAEEVRNLALRSAEAAKTTASLIEESQGNAGNTVTANQQAAQLLRSIVEKVQKSADLIAEVAAASAEQARGIDQVNVAVAQMDRVTQSNASNAEESASASEELSAQARELDDMVGALTSVVSGAKKTLDDTGSSGRDVQQLSGASAVTHTREVERVVHELLAQEKRRAAKVAEGGNGGRANLDPEHVIPLNEAELREF